MSLPRPGAVALSLVLATSAAAQPVPDPHLAARVDAVIEQALADKRIVATVVLIARYGEIVYRRAAGVADREAGVRIREDAIFRLASITKPMVTAAAMRLVEEGCIGLDDPVTRWLPDFRPRLADGREPVVTIRHLLTHTAGLSYGFLEAKDDPYRRAGVSDGLAEPGMSLDENLRRIASVPLAFEPGQSWRYSVSLDVLGGVLEKATGESLPVLVERLVTSPLGLRDAGFSVPDRSRLTVAYADGSPEPIRMRDHEVVKLGEGTVRFAPGRILDPTSFPAGGAGMAGTAQDVLTFLEAIRKGGSPILKPELVKQMMADQVGPQAQTQGPGWGFGFGWAVLTDPQLAGTPQAKGTIQWGGAYGHSWFVDPANGLTVVALTNTAFEGMSGAFPREIRDAVYR
ncbi:serine hydrolase domain-containing protein [Microvirga sp. GCM10011540]|uniref:serine hydrolase domain-containing protein n=1 Tax=Microvirga sp. GCM10011540 TaxID=3317338 RepID=UPI00360D7D31